MALLHSCAGWSEWVRGIQLVATGIEWKLAKSPFPGKAACRGVAATMSNSATHVIRAKTHVTARSAASQPGAQIPKPSRRTEHADLGQYQVYIFHTSLLRLCVHPRCHHPNPWQCSVFLRIIQAISHLGGYCMIYSYDLGHITRVCFLISQKCVCFHNPSHISSRWGRPHSCGVILGI